MLRKTGALLGKSTQWMVAVVSLVLLSACANTWSAKVTTFQNWPSDAFNSPYYIKPATENEPMLEYQAVADTVRVALGSIGLMEGDAESRLQVSFKYENPLVRQWQDQYVDPYFNGFHPHAFMWGGFGYGSGFGGVFYSPRLVSVPVDKYQNIFQVVIKDKAMNMQEIYNVRVINESDSNDLIESMPYLSQAAFTDFPGLNGKTKYIKIKRNQ